MGGQLKTAKILSDKIETTPVITQQAYAAGQFMIFTDETMKCDLSTQTTTPLCS